MSHSKASTLRNLKGVCFIPRKDLIKILVILPAAILAILYAGGYVAQFLYNYDVWQASGGSLYGGSSPEFPSSSFVICLVSIVRFPYGLYGIGICVGALALLILMVMKMGGSDNGEYDRERNLVYSRKGTYGTAGYMSRKEMTEILDLVPDIRKHPGTILGELDGQVVCIPTKTRFNGNMAVYGASGSKKTRAFCVNRILQAAAKLRLDGIGESLIICDPKSELYEKTSAYLADQGFIVKKFDLVTPASSDSWNCLSEIEGQELMAQLFCDVIIKNTGSERGDHFWDNAEMNLLKALVLLVEQGYPPEKRNIGEVYQLLTMSSEKELNALFDVLPAGHPAKAPYNIFKQSGENVRGGVIIGLGSRLQVFQNNDIRMITSHDEIDLELPGKKPCAYYCITSDQDSTFDFLSSLFLSFVFIKLVRFADQKCPGGCLPVPVHVLGEELCACGVIPDLSRKISVIRSRGLTMSCVFQNLAGLQNRYPYNQWQEILGNCDVQLFLGCTDALTADFISARTGETSITVTSQAKQLGTWRVSNYTPEYRETTGVGRRRLLTMDEVLRLDIDKALVIIRGKKILEVDKYDYSKHPEAKKLRSCKASSHVPEWRANQQKQAAAKPAPKKPAAQKPAAPKPPAPSPAPSAPEVKPTQPPKVTITPMTKESIMTKKKEE
jgi:type IV secretion system protein VirD4